MKDFFKLWIAVLGFVVILLSVIWIVQGNEFFLAKVFWPRMEGVRREAFEQSNAYNRGMIQELESLYLEYQKADDNHKKAITSVVSHRYADYPEENLPRHLRSFVTQARK